MLPNSQYCNRCSIASHQGQKPLPLRRRFGHRIRRLWCRRYFAESTVIVEGFIYDILGVALALVVGYHVGDMVFEGCGQRIFCPGSASNYAQSTSIQNLCRDLEYTMMAADCTRPRCGIAASAPFLAPRAVTTSPFVCANVPCIDSILSHFCVFPGIICPNSDVLERIAR